MVAGASGDSGKTVVALGLASLWREAGLAVQPFKKGPDYIDAAWLTFAAGNPARNLDTWLMGGAVVQQAFSRRSVMGGVNLIEANRGLYDGEDEKGAHSSAALAKLLASPVVIVLPVVKVTRTAAAFVLGLRTLDPDVDIVAVVLNFVAGARHQGVTKRAVEELTGIPVVGALPRLRREPLPGRHLGLVTPEEHKFAAAAIASCRAAVADSVDTGRLLILAQNAPTLKPIANEVAAKPGADGNGLRIAYFHGPAFTFYYPENLEALGACGVELLEVNPLEAGELPDCDALYIGGGFPETHAELLAANEQFRHSVRAAAEDGLPIWAECGGLMFLARQIAWKGRQFPMAGVLPVNVTVHDRPQGHGYVEAHAVVSNPFLKKGDRLRGHEFHYSQVESTADLRTAFHLSRGIGIGGGRDGIVHKNVLAAYTHLHSAASPEWADGLVRAARRRRNRS